jgi:hypothetical protein
VSVPTNARPWWEHRIITGPNDYHGATEAEREAWERLWRADTLDESREIMVFELFPMLEARLGTDELAIDPNGPVPRRQEVAA